MRGNRWWMYAGGILLGQVAASLAGSGAWTVSVGPEVRLGMEVQATGSSYVQSLGISSATAASMVPKPRDVSPLYRPDPNPQNPYGYANRTYDDGFVNMDDGTDDPSSIFPGQTWYWGYNNPDQYDAGNNTLSFHRDTTGADVQSAVDVQDWRATSQDVLRDGNLREDEIQNAYGLGLAVGRGILEKQAFQVDVRGGFGMMWGSQTRMRATTYSEGVQVDSFRVVDRYDYSDQFAYRDTYSYDTTGIAPPPAPYAGTLDGPGPVIDNVPATANRDVQNRTRETTRTRDITQTGSTSWTAANEINLSMDSSLYDLWLGPRFSIRPYRAVSLVADTRVSLNYVDVQVDRTERFTTDRQSGNSGLLNEWQDENSHGEWILGLGLSLGIEVEVTRNWRIGFQGGYDWMSQEVAVDVGPDTVSLDPSGFALGATATLVY